VVPLCVEDVGGGLDQVARVVQEDVELAAVERSLDPRLAEADVLGVDNVPVAAGSEAAEVQSLVSYLASLWVKMYGRREINSLNEGGLADLATPDEGDVDEEVRRAGLLGLDEDADGRSSGSGGRLGRRALAEREDARHAVGGLVDRRGARQGRLVVALVVVWLGDTAEEGAGGTRRARRRVAVLARSLLWLTAADGQAGGETVGKVADGGAELLALALTPLTGRFFIVLQRRAECRFVG